MNRGKFSYLNRSLAICFVLACTVLFIGCRTSDEKEVPDQPYAVKKGNIVQAVAAAGSLLFAQKDTLHFGVTGHVSEVLVEPGDTVAAGAALARIEQESLKVELTQAEAALAEAQELLEQAKTPPGYEDFERARESISFAETRVSNSIFELSSIQNAQNMMVDDATRNFEEAMETYSNLFLAYYGITGTQTNIVETPTAILESYPRDPVVLDRLETIIPNAYSQETIDEEIDSAWRLARQAYISLNNAQVTRLKLVNNALITISNNKVEFTTAKDNLQALNDLPDKVQILKREANLSDATEDVRLKKRDLASATLQAPYAGIVTAVSIKTGDQVSAYGSAITIVDPMTIKVSGSVDELDVSSVREGQDVIVTLTSFGGRKFPGTIENVSILPEIQQGIVSYPMTITMDAENLQVGLEKRGTYLREGMRVTATIIIAEVSDIIVIPVEAPKRGDGKGVYVTLQLLDGSRESRQIQLGMTDGKMIQVVKGLTEGDIVLIDKSVAPIQSNFLGARGTRALIGGGGR